jgi:hypothetical protein
MVASNQMQLNVSQLMTLLGNIIDWARSEVNTSLVACVTFVSSCISKSVSNQSVSISDITQQQLCVLDLLSLIRLLASLSDGRTSNQSQSSEMVMDLLTILIQNFLYLPAELDNALHTVFDEAIYPNLTQISPNIYDIYSESNQSADNNHLQKIYSYITANPKISGIYFEICRLYSGLYGKSLAKETMVLLLEIGQIVVQIMKQFVVPNSSNCDIYRGGDWYGGILQRLIAILSRPMKVLYLYKSFLYGQRRDHATTLSPGKHSPYCS